MMFYAVVTRRGVLAYSGDDIEAAAEAFGPGTFHAQGESKAAAAYLARQAATMARIAKREERKNAISFTK